MKFYKYQQIRGFVEMLFLDMPGTVQCIQRISSNIQHKYPSLSLSSNFLPHLQNKADDYKPLLVCHDGGVVSETAAVLARLAKCDANILRGGYASYRHYVEQHLSLEDRKD